MDSSNPKISYPNYLRDYGQLLSYIEVQIGNLSNIEKGNYFVSFVQHLVPQTYIGKRFNYPIINERHSWDGGVDLVAMSPESDAKLFIQSRFSIRTVKDLDSILSHFEAYETKLTDKTQLGLFDVEGVVQNHYMIVTVLDIRSNIVPRFESSRLAGVDFFQKLKSQGRIHIFDGPAILEILKDAYRKSFLLPDLLNIQLASDAIQVGNVFVGVIAGRELKRLYSQVGDSLFLENIREYLGSTGGRVSPGSSRGTTVNEAIAQTLVDNPAEFLARNNGITFRAQKVEKISDQQLRLREASIVNGCQTTMSIVSGPDTDSHVLAKFVETVDSWDIAESANFQNPVDQIALKLARYIRPQMIRAAATNHAMRYYSPEESPFAIIERIYQDEISEQEFRSLFLAFFSVTPTNVLSVNYTKVNTEAVDEIFEQGEGAQAELHETIFAINSVMRRGSELVADSLEADERLLDLFQRFWKERKPQYRALLIVVATCGALGENIYAERPSSDKLTRLLTFARRLADQQPELLVKAYQYAFTAVALDTISANKTREEMLQHMQSNIQHTSFDNLYLKLRTVMTTDAELNKGLRELKITS